MIRFILGMILVFGGVGSIDANMAILPALAVTVAGFALMLWAIGIFKNRAGYNVLRS